MRTPLIAGNFKMFKTVQETVSYVAELRTLVTDVRGVEVVIAPPFTAIQSAAAAAKDSVIGVGAQNVHWEREGAFTGEVSAGMLREAGARFVIVGHLSAGRCSARPTPRSTRRCTQIAAGLTPIVCIGER
jgi:triosephosphate isomerase